VGTLCIFSQKKCRKLILLRSLQNGGTRFVFVRFGNVLSKRPNAYRHFQRILYSKAVPQRPSKGRKRNLHNVAFSERKAIAKAEGVSPKDMNMNISRPAVSLILKVVMLQVGYGVAHILLP
jgi:hypothetical protein